jgi:hypothetical protein
MYKVKQAKTMKQFCIMLSPQKKKKKKKEQH